MSRTHLVEHHGVMAIFVHFDYIHRSRVGILSRRWVHQLEDEFSACHPSPVSASDPDEDTSQSPGAGIYPLSRAEFDKRDGAVLQGHETLCYVLPLINRYSSCGFLRGEGDADVVRMLFR